MGISFFLDFECFFLEEVLSLFLGRCSLGIVVDVGKMETEVFVVDINDVSSGAFGFIIFSLVVCSAHHL